jgi:hypothetical protein
MGRQQCGPPPLSPPGLAPLIFAFGPVGADNRVVTDLVVVIPTPTPVPHHCRRVHGGVGRWQQRLRAAVSGACFHGTLAAKPSAVGGARSREPCSAVRGVQQPTFYHSKLRFPARQQ